MLSTFVVITEPTVKFIIENSPVNFNCFGIFSECLQYGMFRQVVFVIEALNLITRGRTGKVTTKTATLNTLSLFRGKRLTM